MSTQPEQRVTELDADFLARLDAQREVVRAHLGEDPENLRKFDTAAGKLGTIRAILQAGVYDAEDTYELQCLGVVLGDVFAQELGMRWEVVTDEYGSDPALRDTDNPNIIIFPLTMISKRIERGEDVDVFELFKGIAAEVDMMRSDLAS
ncbi:MAG: DUF3806 domain-containing protein [Phycisphaerales bacterium JB050]